MNLKSLTRMSLNSSKGQKDKKEKTKPNDGYERYIGYSPDDDKESPYYPPILYIKNESKAEEITLSVQRNAFVLATIENTKTHYMQTGCSTGNITEIFNKLESVTFVNTNDSYRAADILFYGFICEALCRTGIDLNLILADTDALKEFIRASISYCITDFSYFPEHDITDFQADFKITENTPDSEETVIRKFILPNKTLLKRTDSGFSLQVSESKVYTIQPPFLRFLDRKNFNDMEISLIWILFESLGFHVKESIHCSKIDDDFQIPISEFENAQIISPSAIAGELCHVKAWEEYEKELRRIRTIAHEIRKEKGLI